MGDWRSKADASTFENFGNSKDVGDYA